jgi:AbrB family looped-hinge helix DNA binding protein
MRNNFPKGKGAWTAKVGEKGQIVIPKEARDMFDIQPGDTLILLGDIKRGLAIIGGNKMNTLAEKMLDSIVGSENEEKVENEEKTENE